MKAGAGLILLLVLAVAPSARAVDRFTQDFGRDPINERILRYVGASTEQAITRTERGLLVKLPVEKSGQSQAGVATKFIVEGDFEITAGYELQNIAQPEKGYGAGVMLRLFTAGGTHQRVNLSRFKRSSGEDTFGANVWKEAKGELRPNSEQFPAQGERGQLRVVRTSSTLIYLVAEGDGEFRELRRIEDFGREPLKAVEFLADTGGSEQPLSVRLTHLTIVADELPFGTPARRRSTIWSVWTAFGVLGVAILAVAGGWYWRQRR